MSDGTVETVTGKSATIRFDSRLCIHARRCVLGEPAVFKANVVGPWIDPDAASADDVGVRIIADQVRRERVVIGVRQR